MRIKGSIEIPGDKSISHRALIFAALSDGICNISNISKGLDVKSTRRSLSLCGIKSTADSVFTTVAGGDLVNPDQPLDCGNSGTTARLLLGLLAGKGINAWFIGDNSLISRPMKRVIEPLEKMGCEIRSTDERLPISISNSPINGIYYTLPVPSAQVKSAIIFAGLGAQNTTTIIEPLKSRDHTEIMLNNLGGDIQISGDTIKIQPLTKPLKSFDIIVPGDPSSAAFFIAAAVLIPNSDLIIKNILLNPTRIGFINVLTRMGANIEIVDQRGAGGEMIGDILVRYSQLSGITLSKSDIPGIIDELPILAIVASQAKGISEIRGAGELRVKESDRISAIYKNLIKLGAKITEFDDGFKIEGPCKLSGGKIETHNDHRIAMAFSIAGLISEGKVQIDTPECVSVSFPEFFSLLKSVTE
jgi:3-phosphoshikimate 1-carboxyvinyltransferase